MGRNRPTAFAHLLCAGTALLFAACDTGGVSQQIPTLTLIPPAASVTPSPTLEPTATTRLLPAPADLRTDPAPTPDAVNTPTLLQSDPVAAEMVDIARLRVAEESGIAPQDQQLLQVVPVQWEDNSLGCPQPQRQYTRMLANGYRIVLVAGNQQYIFHTDFNRIFLCPPEFELLPEGIPTAAAVEPEATAENTPLLEETTAPTADSPNNP